MSDNDNSNPFEFSDDEGSGSEVFQQFGYGAEYDDVDDASELISQSKPSELEKEEISIVNEPVNDLFESEDESEGNSFGFKSDRSDSGDERMSDHEKDKEEEKREPVFEPEDENISMTKTLQSEFSDIDWNMQFQNALDMKDGTNKWEQLAHLARDFVYCSKTYGKIIISEYYLPDEKKTIKPLQAGGIAGGSKYICSSIFFKFALDTDITHILIENGQNPTSKFWMYGGINGPDNTAAQKAAKNDMVGLLSYYNTNTPDLHFPLMAIIDFRGFRLIAMSILPIGKTTLRYGTADGGKSIRASDEVLNQKMKSTAKLLNLKGHYVCSGTHKVKIYGPADVEGHIGTDNKYYVLDFGRVFPPEPPHIRPGNTKPTPKDARKIFYELFRPEFLRDYPKPLSSDAFSGFGQHDKQIHDAEVKEAGDYLYSNTIPTFANELIQQIANEDYEVRLTEMLHRRGINCRHLGYVRKEVPPNAPFIKKLILTEIVARTLSQILRDFLRAEMQEIKIACQQPYNNLVLKFINSMFIGRSNASAIQLEKFITSRPLKDCQLINGSLLNVIKDLNSGNSPQFHTSLLDRHLTKLPKNMKKSRAKPRTTPRAIIGQYKELNGEACLSVDDLESSTFWKTTIKKIIEAKFRSTFTEEELKDEQDIRLMIDRSHLVRRLCQQVGIKLSKQAMNELTSSPDTFQLKRYDLRSVSARVKHLNVIDLAEGNLMFLEAINSLNTRKGIWDECNKKFAMAVASNTNNPQTFIRWGTLLLEQSERILLDDPNAIPEAEKILISAEDKFSSASTINPNLWEPYFGWGKALIGRTVLLLSKTSKDSSAFAMWFIIKAGLHLQKSFFMYPESFYYIIQYAEEYILRANREKEETSNLVLCRFYLLTSFIALRAAIPVAPFKPNPSTYFLVARIIVEYLIVGGNDRGKHFTGIASSFLEAGLLIHPVISDADMIYLHDKYLSYGKKFITKDDLKVLKRDFESVLIYKVINDECKVSTISSIGISHLSELYFSPVVTEDPSNSYYDSFFINQQFHMLSPSVKSKVVSFTTKRKTMILTNSPLNYFLLEEIRMRLPNDPDKIPLRILFYATTILTSVSAFESLYELESEDIRGGIPQDMGKFFLITTVEFGPSDLPGSIISREVPQHPNASYLIVMFVPRDDSVKTLEFYWFQFFGIQVRRNNLNNLLNATEAKSEHNSEDEDDGDNDEDDTFANVGGGGGLVKYDLLTSTQHIKIENKMLEDIRKASGSDLTQNSNSPSNPEATTSPSSSSSKLSSSSTNVANSATNTEKAVSEVVTSSNTDLETKIETTASEQTTDLRSSSSGLAKQPLRDKYKKERKKRKKQKNDVNDDTETTTEENNKSNNNEKKEKKPKRKRKSHSIKGAEKIVHTEKLTQSTNVDLYITEMQKVRAENRRNLQPWKEALVHVNKGAPLRQFCSRKTVDTASRDVAKKLELSNNNNNNDNNNDNINNDNVNNDNKKNENCKSTPTTPIHGDHGHDDPTDKNGDGSAKGFLQFLNETTYSSPELNIIREDLRRSTPTKVAQLLGMIEDENDNDSHHHHHQHHKSKREKMKDKIIGKGRYRGHAAATEEMKWRTEPFIYPNYISFLGNKTAFFPPLSHPIQLQCTSPFLTKNDQKERAENPVVLWCDNLGGVHTQTMMIGARSAYLKLYGFQAKKAPLLIEVFTSISQLCNWLITNKEKAALLLSANKLRIITCKSTPQEGKKAYLDLIKWVKAHPDWKSTPILFFSPSEKLTTQTIDPANNILATTLTQVMIEFMAMHDISKYFDKSTIQALRNIRTPLHLRDKMTFVKTHLVADVPAISPLLSVPSHKSTIKSLESSLPLKFSYYEVKVDRLPPNTVVIIGISPSLRDDDLFSSKKRSNVNSQFIGLHNKLGICTPLIDSPSSSSSSSPKFVYHKFLDDIQPKFRSGDVIGCGFHDKTRQIFWTKNGTFLGFAEGSHSKLADPDLTLYFPTVYVDFSHDSLLSITSNFGDEPFMYDLKNEANFLSANDVRVWKQKEKQSDLTPTFNLFEDCHKQGTYLAAVIKLATRSRELYILLQAHLSHEKYSPLDLSNTSINDHEMEMILTMNITIDKLNLSNCSKITDRTIQTLFSNTSPHKAINELLLKGNSHFTEVTTLLLLENATNLLSLSMWETCSTQAIANISGISSITKLDLSYCTNLTDSVFSLIIQNKGLQLLYLNVTSCSQLTDKSMLSLSKSNSMGSLVTLCISNCTLLEDKGLIKVAKKVTKLENIGIAGNSLQSLKLTDESIGEMISHSAHTLKAINLYRSTITKKSLDILSTCKNLQEIDLGHCSCIPLPSLTSFICVLNSLVCADFYDTLLDDANLLVLCKQHKNLESLSIQLCRNISANGIQDALGFMRNIKNLNLRELPLTGELILNLAASYLPKLQFLDITRSSNYIPVEYTKFLAQSKPTTNILVTTKGNFNNSKALSSLRPRKNSL